MTLSLFQRLLINGASRAVDKLHRKFNPVIENERIIITIEVDLHKVIGEDGQVVNVMWDENEVIRNVTNKIRNEIEQPDILNQ